MTLERAFDLLTVQAEFGGTYNRNSARLILSTVRREFGQDAVDKLIRDLKLQQIFGFEPAGKL